MGTDINQLLNELSGGTSGSSGVLGAVTGAVSGTSGKGQTVLVGGRRYRVRQTSQGNFLIPVSRTKKISFSERTLKGMLALVSTGARMAGGGKRGHFRASVPSYIFRKHGH